MKRGIIAAVIIIIIIAFATTVNIMLEKETDLLYEFADCASTDRTQLEKLCNEWEKQIIYFKFFTDHGYFETIDKKIKKLRYLDGESYVTTCKDIMIDFQTLKEDISFSFGNIF